MSSRISIILVEPEVPDNIGAAARAMKNMGLSDLRLVQPPVDWKQRAVKMAVKAYERIERAKVFSSLREAASDARLVIGTTRRQGRRRGNFLAYGEAIDKICKTRGPVAVVFGKESKGLSNRDLRACGWLVTIPASDKYPSLNLAQAVMVVAFSIFTRLAVPGSGQMTKNLAPLASLAQSFVPRREIDDILVRMEQALDGLGYKRDNGRNVLGRILATHAGLFQRAGLLRKEAQMLRGLARRILERMKTRQA